MARQYHIALEYNGIVRDIFMFGYDGKGGFFLLDLTEPEHAYHIVKLRVRLGTYGTQKVPMENSQQWITRRKPKLIRHPDGFSQISGVGIRPGN